MYRFIVFDKLAPETLIGLQRPNGWYSANDRSNRLL